MTRKIISGRTVRWKDWGIEYEADPRHGSEVLKYFGFNDRTSGQLTNGRVDECKEEVDEVELSESEATMFRGLAAKVNFLAQDCTDLQFPAKEVCRDMSFPTVASWARLKRLARYLVIRKVVIFQYEWQDEGKLMTLYTDSHWAGCRRTRKSTGPIALSSAEAEYYSMVEGLSRPRACRRLLERLDGC